MDFTSKFNRALLNAIRDNKVVVENLNSGAIRKASVKFKFSHSGSLHHFQLSSTRTADGLELFGYPEKLELDLTSFNPSYTSGVKCDVEAVDRSAVKYLHACSVISADDSLDVRRHYSELFNQFSTAMA